MPLFYFRKFDFFPEKRKRVIDLNDTDIWLYGGIGLLIFLMVVAFVVIPAVALILQSQGIALPF